MITWIKTSDKMPDVDMSDSWNKSNHISKRLLIYTKEFGIGFGRFYHKADMWTMEGVSSSNGIQVSHWAELNKPEN